MKYQGGFAAAGWSPPAAPRMPVRQVTKLPRGPVWYYISS